MALTIATGFVVDDAIVVIENITRYRRKWHVADAAALEGAQEIGSTVLSISISLIAVFIPIFLMAGYRGTPVPRVRRHAFGRDRDLAAGFADAYADDVLACCCRTSRPSATACCIGPAKAASKLIPRVYDAQLCAGCCAISR